MAAADHQPQGDGGVQMATRDMSDGEGHGQQGQPEGQCDAEQAYAYVRKRGGEHGAAAPPQNQPKCADQLGGELPREWHVQLRYSMFFAGRMNCREPGIKIPESAPRG